ncbi:MAG: S8 family serine peptidase [Deltaproteobacteria bacterium]|nr:S8 family serine peptidase [Deltaproteobacteria bacterium]
MRSAIERGVRPAGPWLVAFVGLATCLASGASAGEFGYIDSRGQRVELELAADRIAVVPAGPGALEAIARELGPEASRAHRRGRFLAEIALESGAETDRALEALLADGLVSRAGLAFRSPSGRVFFLDRQVLVGLARPAVRADAAVLLARTGLEPVEALGHGGWIWLCRARDARAALGAASECARLPGVRWALPDFTFPAALAHRPTDPYYGEQWYHAQPGDAHLHTEEAWDLTFGDAAVVVAVIDTGLEESHPDFDPARIITGYNYPQDSDDPTPEADSLNAHGTACAGEIAASIDNAEGMAGVCPGCSLMGVKMFTEGAYADLSGCYMAIQYAVDHGAWVLSMSWGIDPGQVDLEPFREAIREAVELGRGGLGAVVLFASGNGNMWTGEAEPIGSAELQNMPEVMAVGGSDPFDRWVSYSDYGPNLSVVAPTGGLDPTEPGILTTDTLGSRGFSRNGTYWTWAFFGDMDTGIAEPDPTGDYTAHFSGTSAACPLAAGVVALVLSAHPGLTGAQARFVVERTADKVGGVSYDASGHNDYYGHGRVNAGRAVRAAAAGFGNPPGAACAEDFNCAWGACEKSSPGAFYGQCTDFDCAVDPEGSPCTDFDACTTGDVCTGGACAGSPADCDDFNACTADGCDPSSGCTHDPVPGDCDDGDACTSNDSCADGRCQGEPVICDDGDACTADRCDPQAGCTVEPRSCDDFDACTADGCDPLSGCWHETVSCDDGDPCTLDSCDRYSGCVYLEQSCDDGDPCTADRCEPGEGCVHEEQSCDDGDACTLDRCVEGDGCSHEQRSCDDGDACTLDGCDPESGCTHAPSSGSPCDDGDACSADDTCRDGICLGSPLDCSHLDAACRRGECDPASGTCVGAALEDGLSCDDGDPCTERERCRAGQCIGEELDCGVDNPCQRGVCDPQTGACVAEDLPDGTPCSSGEPCIQDELCSAGQCGGGIDYCINTTGCDCATGRAGAGGLPLALLAIGWAVLRRRGGGTGSAS